MTLRISLTAEDFDNLVAGRIVRVGEDAMMVEIALQDIGFTHMIDAIRDAMPPPAQARQDARDTWEHRQLAHAYMTSHPGTSLSDAYQVVYPAYLKMRTGG